MDTKDFYPSITEENLDTLIAFAHINTNISNEDMQIITHSRKSLLFHNPRAWKNKSTSCFETKIGSHDSTKVCELLGIFVCMYVDVVLDIVQSELN